MAEAVNNNNEKYSTKSIIQIGALFFCVFTLVLVLMAFCIYTAGTRLYLNTKNEDITQSLVKMEESMSKIRNLEWAIEFWEEHPEDVMVAHEDEKYNDITRSQLCPAAQEPYMYSMDELSALPYEEQLEVACVLYNSASLRLMEHAHFYSFNAAYIINISEEKRGMIDVEDRYVDSNGRFEERLGYIVSYSEEEHPVIKKYLSGETKEIEFEIVRNSSVDGKNYYIGCLPLVKQDGSIDHLLCIAYDWSAYESTLRESLGYMITGGVLVGVFTALILMFFVYLIVVKPLTIVSRSVEEYTEHKDSVVVNESLSNIRTRNEVGLLAKNISMMATEIDRYTDEIATLASEKERVESELKLAAKIQSSMLTKVFPESNQYELYASMDPAKEVGGDFYDFFMLDDDHLGLVIADVSGKGIPAALFMAMSKMHIRNFADTNTSPAETLRLANEAIVADNENKMFVTVWFAIVELSTGHVRAANSGHEYPILRKAGEPFEILKDKHGFVLGAMKTVKTHDYEFDLGPGDVIFVYTDGAPESTNVDVEMFGMQRLVDTLNVDPDKNPEGMISAVSAAIDEFVGEADQFDDLTMLCFKYKGK